MPFEAVISIGAYERTGSEPSYAVNCFPEEISTAEGPRFELRARPGMDALATVGAGTLRGAHQKDGLFSDAALIVSGITVYTLTAAGVATALAGSVLGTDLVDIDSGLDADLNSVARIATGSALYKVSGGIVTQEDFPEAGGAGASSVCFHASFWLATEAGTDKVYYLAPGSTTWTALDFASAEYAPDPLVAVRSRGDQIAVLGSATFEAWSVSTGTPAPYGGLAFRTGGRTRNAAIVAGEALVFVDNTCQVQRWRGGGLEPIGDPGLVEQIAAVDADDLAMWAFPMQGHWFCVLHLGETETWVHDLTGPPKRWVKWESATLDYWRAKLGCNIGDTVIATDATGAQVWALNADTRQDGSDEFSFGFSAVIPATYKPQSVANVVLIAEQGDTPLTGQGSDPLVGMKWSDDGSKTFNNWRYKSMGASGERRTQPRWNALGTVPANRSRTFRFLISDPITRVIRMVLVNV